VKQGNGEPPHSDTITRRFKKLAGHAGLPEIGLHDVRHSYATAGFNAKRPRAHPCMPDRDGAIVVTGSGLRWRHREYLEACDGAIAGPGGKWRWRHRGR
jgi:hypothetical protein